jgi:hypothetical protein
MRHTRIMNTFYLRLFSVGYLLAPTLLFLGNWFRIEYSIFFVAGHLFFFNSYTRKSADNETVIPLKSLAGIAAVALVWTVLMGVGGFFLQTTDHVAHNTKFNELFLNSWPIVFDQKETFSCYYYGFYLVPGLFFKLIGDISVSAIVIYTVIGVTLGLAWLYLLLLRNMYAVIVFILCGGILFSAKLLIYALFKIDFSYNPVLSLFYQSTYVPNQIIPTLICAGMFLFYRHDYRLSFYPITLFFYWAVFPALLLILLFGLNFCYDYLIKKRQITWKSLFVDYVIPCALFLPTFIFLISSDHIAVQGFYDFSKLETYTPFIDIILLGLITFVLNKNRKTSDESVPVSIIVFAVILLALLLTYRIGVYNDLFMRGSMPLFYIVLVNIFQRMYLNTSNLEKDKVYSENPVKNTQSRFTYLSKYPLIVIWIMIGSLASLNQLRVLASSNVFANSYEPFLYKTFPNSYEVLLKYYGQEGADQYLGDPTSFYYLYLAPSKKDH